MTVRRRRLAAKRESRIRINGRTPRVATATPRLFRKLEPHFRLHNVRGLHHVFDSTGAGGFLYFAAILTREAVGYIASGLFMSSSSFRSFN